MLPYLILAFICPCVDPCSITSRCKTSKHHGMYIIDIHFVETIDLFLILFIVDELGPKMIDISSKNLGESTKHKKFLHYSIYNSQNPRIIVIFLTDNSDLISVSSNLPNGPLGNYTSSTLIFLNGLII